MSRVIAFLIVLVIPALCKSLKSSPPPPQLGEVSRWRGQCRVLEDYSAEVGSQQSQHQLLLAELPGYEMGALQTACSKEAELYKDTASSLDELISVVQGLELDTASLRNQLAANAER